jgi:hypothetical protein
MQRFSDSLLFAAAMCYPAAALDRNPEITIHMYDYSGVQPSVRTHAQQSAEAILHQAGIAIHWRDCPLGIPKTAGAPACGAGTADVTHFVVAILPASMSARIATSPEQFGITVMGHAGGFPTQAYVFMDRITDFAAEANAPCGSLLGVITAHEIGHLLLGSDSHSSAGIMRRKWTSEDVKKVLMGVLTFTGRQAELMRAEVRRRMHAMN